MGRPAPAGPLLLASPARRRGSYRAPRNLVAPFQHTQRLSDPRNRVERDAAQPPEQTLQFHGDDQLVLDDKNSQPRSNERTSPTHLRPPAGGRKESQESGVGPPLRQIRLKCCECMGGEHGSIPRGEVARAIEECSAVACPLWPYSWYRCPDLSIPQALLPPLDQHRAERFLRALAGALERAGATEIKLSGCHGG
jgi:hypothetical protein